MKYTIENREILEPFGKLAGAFRSMGFVKVPRMNANVPIPSRGSKRSKFYVRSKPSAKPKCDSFHDTSGVGHINKNGHKEHCHVRFDSAVKLVGRHVVCVRNTDIPAISGDLAVAAFVNSHKHIVLNRFQLMSNPRLSRKIATRFHKTCRS